MQQRIKQLFLHLYILPKKFIGLLCSKKVRMEVLIIKYFKIMYAPSLLFKILVLFSYKEIHMKGCFHENN
ncbi:hypothetical protein EFP69_00510 [Lactobacillus helveticus]|nr:hypothetical protein [Lactobacillus helveticus]